MATLALIAHDGKKDEMRDFVRKHRAVLASHRLVATASTGRMIQKEGLDVHLFCHGPEGGDVLIAAEAIEGRVQMVLFLIEPRETHPHDPDIRTLLRVCNLYDIPLATNPATAELLLTGWASR